MLVLVGLGQLGPPLLDRQEQLGRVAQPPLGQPRMCNSWAEVELAEIHNSVPVALVGLVGRLEWMPR